MFLPIYLCTFNKIPYISNILNVVIRVRTLSIMHSQVCNGCFYFIRAEFAKGARPIVSLAKSKHQELQDTAFSHAYSRSLLYYLL